MAARPRVVHAHLEAVRAEIRLAKQQRQQARRERRAATKASSTGRHKQHKSSFGPGLHDWKPVDKPKASTEYPLGDSGGDDKDEVGVLQDSAPASEGHASIPSSSRGQSSPRGHSRRRRVRFRLDVRWKLERNDIVEM